MNLTIGRKDRIFSQEQLEERLEYWQNRLRLNHWTIAVDIREDNDDSEGRNNYSTSLMESRISLVHPNKHGAPGGYDMEFILIHELLHLIVEVNRHSSNYEDHQAWELEAAINSLTRTLITLNDELEEARHETN